MRLSPPPCPAQPLEIKWHTQSRLLEVSFDDGAVFELPAEYLRVYTQSAEAVGHGPGQETLQTGKQDVMIEEIRPIGQYAIAFRFSDGHNSGIYSWDLLYYLGDRFPELWSYYLQLLQDAGIERRPAATS
jgi:DUF971 family protein